jgi:hypothetical protein
LDKKKQDKTTRVKRERTLFQKVVNVFLYICIGFIILFLIFLGISQTYTFREYLRETIIEEANSAFNGKVYIEKIEGTIFTSLILHNTVVNMEKDTVLKAGTIKVLSSPLQLLLKKIYIRDFEINNVVFNLSSDSLGILNISKLFPATEPDTTSSEFTFKIQIANLELHDIDFSYHDFNNRNNPQIYPEANYNNVKLKDINLELSAVADINNNDYELSLYHLSFSPNISGFNLKNFRGEFIINQKSIFIRNFEMETDKSDFNLSFVSNDFNLFDTVSTNFSDANFTLIANSRSFSLDELEAFLPSSEVLGGDVAFDLNVSGTLAELDLNHIQVLLQNSNIKGEGHIKNLDEPGNLFISADLSESFIDQGDIQKLIPSLGIPLYRELGVIRFDTLMYKGSPLNFNTNADIVTDKGSLSCLLDLNFEKESVKYNASFSTGNFDLKPFVGISSSINLSGKVKGKGITPEDFDGSVNLTANGSVLNGNMLDTLKFIANADNRNVAYNFRLVSKETKTGIKGEIDFTNEEKPLYRLSGEINNFDAAMFLRDSAIHTDINLKFDGEGESFDQDEMNLFANMKLFNSQLGNIPIDSLRAIVDLQSGNGRERIINIISDVADVTMTGNFKVDDAITLLTNEADLLSSVYVNKLSRLLPSTFTNGREELKTYGPSLDEVSPAMNIDYTIELKDFDIISAFMGDYHFEIDAVMGGKISSGDNTQFSFNTDIDYLKFWSEEEAFFLTNANLNLNVKHGFEVASTSDIGMGLDVSAERIFMGSDVYDFHFDMSMEKDVAQVNFGAKQGAMVLQFNSVIDVSTEIFDVSVDSLAFSYDEFLVENKEPISFTYTEDRIDIKKFNMVHNGADIKADGFLSQKGDQKLKVSLSAFKGEDLSASILHLRPENSLGANINLAFDVTGNMKVPEINMDMTVDSVKYGSRTFGTLKSKIDYKNQNINLDIAFIDSLFNPTSPALIITGYVPFDLFPNTSVDDYIEAKPMAVHLESDGFNLGAFGDILPVVNRLKGNLTSDLKITGTLSSPTTQGFLRVKNASFFLEANNLEYNASANIEVEGKRLTVDSIVVANVPGTVNGGKMIGSGVALLENFAITSSKFSLGGDLKVLDVVSKSASPSVYGSLVVGTNGNIELELEEGRIFMEAPVVLKNVNLIFPQTQSAYQGNSESYVYRFVKDTMSISNDKRDFERLVNIAQNQGAEKSSSSSKKNILDYDLKVTIEDEATVIFVLSKEFNQNLKAVLDGNLRLEKYGTKTSAQGQLTLLEGSTLEFLKTLEAEGSIRFESELTNPYLDIVATYKDYYYPAEGSDADKEVEVAVKIEITGPLKELNENLISEGNKNIKVYYGSENIEKNNPSPQYDASDAAMFILLGKFNDDATQQDRNAVASTAAGLAGSLVGGFLNRQFGDVIKSVELRQVGTTTKISLIGRAGNFRYEVGTSTDVYQDLSRANVKVEYPITRSFLLRLERKEAINTETTYTSEMINELGLKYRFEF